MNVGDRAQAMLDCLAAAGFPAAIDGTGLIQTTGEIPEAQSSQSDAAMNRCTAETGFGDLSVLSLEERKQMYALEVENEACIREAGYPTELPPSEQAYLDAFGTSEQYQAISGAIMAGISAKDVYALHEKCPVPRWVYDLSGF